MKIHFYSSYKLSPVGFHYGSFLLGNNELFELSQIYNRDFFKKVFTKKYLSCNSDFDIVYYGKIPGSEYHAIIVKNIEYRYDDKHEDLCKILYLNIGFEFESYDEFKTYIGGLLEADKKKFSELLAFSVIPDTDKEKNSFGLKIAASKFNSALELLKSIGGSKNLEKFDENEMRFFAQANKDYTKDIEKDFDLINIKRSSDDKKLYIQKKNVTPYLMSFMALMVLAMMGVLFGQRLMGPANMLETKTTMGSPVTATDPMAMSEKLIASQTVVTETMPTLEATVTPLTVTTETIVMPAMPTVELSTESNPVTTNTVEIGVKR